MERQNILTAVKEYVKLHPEEKTELFEQLKLEIAPEEKIDDSLDDFYDYMRKERGVDLNQGITSASLAKMVGALKEIADVECFKLPWEKMNLGKSNDPDSKVYSMFPIRNPYPWECFTKQEKCLWSAKEIPYAEDAKQFPSLPLRIKQLYYLLLGFFAPGDGIVSKNVIRFILECKNYEEMMFFIIQLYIEAVHSEAYGMSITMIIPDAETQRQVFAMADNLDCVKAKTTFMKKYIESSKSKPLRYVASCVNERILFVSLFAIVFYLKSIGVLNAFAYLNQLVMRDETLHGDFYGEMAKRSGELEYEEVLEIIKEGVEVEISFVKALLSEPIQSASADALGGMTIEALSNYVKSLGDQVLDLLGFAPYYNIKTTLPWMIGQGLSEHNNFYERQGTYQKYGIQIELPGAGGQVKVVKDENDAIDNPEDVDF